MVYGIREFFRHPEDRKKAGLEGTLEGKTVIVQGLGNVGYHTAKILESEDGAKIIGIIEHDGALMDLNGLSVEAVNTYNKEHGGVKGYPDAEYFENGRRDSGRGMRPFGSRRRWKGSFIWGTPRASRPK